MLVSPNPRGVEDLERENAMLTERLRASREETARSAKDYVRLAEMATTDELTGLMNYRCFKEILKTACALAVRRGDPLSVVVAAVDGLEGFNFAFGRQSGDDVLHTVALVLQQILRGSDVAARYGGKKFVLLFPSSGACGGLLAAERIRTAVERHPWPLAPVTVSLGVTTTTGVGVTAAGVIKEAVAALVRSRLRGDNSVAHHHDGS